MFNKRLRTVRMSCGMTQEKTAEAIGITLRGYQFYEQGKCEPSFETLVKLADLFHVSTDYLLCHDTPKDEA